MRDRDTEQCAHCALEGDIESVGIPKANQQAVAVSVLSSSDCEKAFIIPNKSQICVGGDRGKDSSRVSEGEKRISIKLISSK